MQGTNNSGYYYCVGCIGNWHRLPAYPNHHASMAKLYVQSMCDQICGTNSYCDSSLACVCNAGYEEDTTTTTTA